MADNPYKAGDVVSLKSGGPRMTVDALLGNGAVICCWFTESAQRFTAIFGTDTLTTDADDRAEKKSGEVH